MTNRHHEKANEVDCDLKRQHSGCKTTTFALEEKVFFYFPCVTPCFTKTDILFLDVLVLWSFFLHNTFCVLILTVLHQGSIEGAKGIYSDPVA